MKTVGRLAGAKDFTNHGQDRRDTLGKDRAGRTGHSAGTCRSRMRIGVGTSRAGGSRAPRRRGPGSESGTRGWRSGDGPEVACPGSYRPRGGTGLQSGGEGGQGRTDQDHPRTRRAGSRGVYEQQSSSQPTEKAAQAAPAPTAAPQTSGGQLTASDVQKAMNSSAAAAQAAPPGQRGPVVKQAAAAGGPISRPAPVSPPSATTFRDYERSRFASTSEDSVSTFSLDTDRTSFQLALNWARSGHAVDPDSVRAEEWINAFNYGYAPPAHRDSFAITTDVFTHPLDSRMHLVRLGFQAPELQDDAPLNVTLVLDASGSMSNGNRVAIAREAAESIRRSLRSRDRIGVVHFTTDVIEHLTVEHAGPDDRAVRRSIDRLTPHNSTNVQAGLDLGVKLADRVRRERPDAYNYIILMSDGVANVDATDPFAILESAYDADSGNPLRLITIGVGIENYNDYLLEQLAQHGTAGTGTWATRSRPGRPSAAIAGLPFLSRLRTRPARR